MRSYAAAPLWSSFLLGAREPSCACFDGNLAGGGEGFAGFVQSFSSSSFAEDGSIEGWFPVTSADVVGEDCQDDQNHHNSYQESGLYGHSEGVVTKFF